jgi:hypothetical protein
MKHTPKYNIGDVVVYRCKSILITTTVRKSYYATHTAIYKLHKEKDEENIYDESALRLATKEEQLKHLLSN